MKKPGRRELNKIQCRSRILRTSRRLFTAKGYENTTIEDIAEAAEISKATLYNYFPSKENLMLGIGESALEDVRRLIEQELKDEPSPLRRLRQVMESMAVDSVRYVSLTRRMVYLNASPDSTLYDTRKGIYNLMLKLVEEAQQAGELRSDRTPDEMTQAFLAIYLLIQFGWENPDRLTEEECLRQVNRAMETALEGLRPCDA